MKKQQTSFLIITAILCMSFLGCEAMAELFHGPKTYTVTFNANGANGSPPAAQSINPGSFVTLPGQGGMSSAGNVFVGWNENPGGAGITYSTGSSIMVNGDMVFYAQWLDASTPQYTVTFNPNGATGGMSPVAQTVYSGISITVPNQGTLVHDSKKFGGWNTQASGSGTSYTVGAAYKVTADVTLYAKWQSGDGESDPIEPPGATLVEKLEYIRNNAGDGTVFDIVVDRNETITPQTIATMGRNITVIIRSPSSADVKTIQLDGQGHLFSVDTGITLKLQDIVLQGHSNNSVALVGVGNGTLTLNSGAKITGNTNYSAVDGGGIYVNGGILEMNEGSGISGNRLRANQSYGAGILVNNRGSVFIKGGLISENAYIGDSWCRGVGISIRGSSTVNMHGGIISKNTFTINGAGYGGGVYIHDNTSSFIKRAASGNSTSGIIYGGSGGDANSLGDYWQNEGHTIYRNWGTLRNRNTTLGGYDEISTGNDVGWE